MNDSTHDDVWPRIDQLVDRGAPGGCWIYTGQHDRYGYGKHRASGGRWVAPHRVAYEALVGPIPKGLVIDHLCRVRDCCNPAHLEPVTNRENTMRGETIAARRAAQTHCVNGHVLDGDNVYLRPKTGTRTCKECSRVRARAYKAKIRAQVA